MRCVIPSVNYSDFLDFIVPYWIKVLPPNSITVVTSLTDQATVDVARSHGLDCCQTDIWYEQTQVDNSKKGDVVFNKAAALDLALGLTPGYREAPLQGERCLSIDCDVVPFGKIPKEWELQSNILYGCPRYQCETIEGFNKYVAGDGSTLPLILPRMRGDKSGRYSIAARETPQAAGSACLGYFQLFLYRPTITFGNFKTAGGYDIEFRRHFGKRLSLNKIHVLHLGEQQRANWKGRVVGKWPHA